MVIILIYLSKSNTCRDSWRAGRYPDWTRWTRRVPISVPIQWTKLRPFPHYPYSYSDAVTKTIFSIHTSPQLVLAKRHNICEVTEILFVGEGRHSLLYLIEHLLSLRQNLSCQNGHFLVKLRSHIDHLWPPTAIVRCG